MKFKKKRGRLAAKFTSMVLAVVLVAFLLAFVIYLGTTYTYYRNQIISNQQYQLEKTASQIRTLQTTVENMGKQILYDDAVLSYMDMEEDSSGNYLYGKRRVQRTLANYSYIVDGTVEIMIYTNDGRTLSSRDVKSPFVPEENDWYQEFLSRNVNSGFSKVHDSEPSSNSISIDVVSYIMSFYSIGNNSHELGKMIIDLDASMIQEMLETSEELVLGNCLSDWQGQPLILQGDMQRQENFPKSEAELEESEQHTLLASMDRVELFAGDMKDNWTIHVEISGKKLLEMAFYANSWILLVHGIILAVLLVLLRFFIRRITEPIQKLSDTAMEVGGGNLNASVEIHTGDELETLAEVFNDMVNDVRELMNESLEFEKQRRHMQIENLMLQINPHFIYNTINSIVYMARMSGNPQIADFANAFISLMQSTLDVRDSIYNTVGRELKTVENYLYLQKYRYADKFVYRVECDPELMDCQILNVMLQPAVENAIFHGIAPMDTSEKPGELVISIHRREDRLIIKVRDDGVGMTPEVLEEQMKPEHVQRDGVRKIGVANVRDRIRNVYGPPYELRIESVYGEGTCVTMEVPYEKEAK